MTATVTLDELDRMIERLEQATEQVRRARRIQEAIPDPREGVEGALRIARCTAQAAVDELPTFSVPERTDPSSCTCGRRRWTR